MTEITLDRDKLAKKLWQYDWDSDQDDAYETYASLNQIENYLKKADYLIALLPQLLVAVKP